MKTSKLLASASITGVVVAGTVVAPALAWHPKGAIVKSVENTTTGSAMSDANDESTAVSAKPGDVLKYTIKVSNEGEPSSDGDNDMVKTTLTDTLPTGVELVSDPSQRTLTANLGNVKPGKSVTKTYLVKVTSETDGDVITNKACFKGDSGANDNPQKGCDVAVVTVTVPETPTPTPTPTPQPTQPTPTTPEQPTTLPNTGAGSVLLIGAIVSALGYAAYLLRLKFRATQR